MAGLIKGQILKHLSKFVKNLAPSQISLSAIKGEGELSNLELNEVVLTELLELPSWIRLTKATCNRAAIRIQWTKLKTVPIQLQLDEIFIELETCEELRDPSMSPPGLSPPGAGTGAYGFTDKVVDGITVSVNLVYVTLSSLAFTASFQMSRILLESKTPVWKKGNLQMTRLKDLDRGEVLIFKELSWQTVRIEARSTVNKDLTPLRLITNQARCRITIKKRMTDSAVLGCRLVLILDDLLWVLTDDQLKAALHFMDSISGLIKKATTTTQKVKAERKLKNQNSIPGGGGMQMPRARGSSAMGGHGSATANTFANYDVFETSYHFYCNRIDLHFCDDPGGGRSLHPNLSNGGAFQVSLSKLQVDYYPYHLARGDRKHWVRYTEASPHRTWMNANLASFDTRLLDVLLSGRNHTPLSRAGKPTVAAASAGGQTQRGDREDDGIRDIVVKQLSRLMTENFVVRLFDLTVYCVSTTSHSGAKLREMVKGDHGRLHIPEDLPFLHLEFTSFYYPGDLDFPLPPPCVMVHLNPFTVWLDILTLVWINAFILNLQKSVNSLQASLDLEQSDSLYADMKLEILMPRVIVGSNIKHKIPSDKKPSSLQVHASKISIANYRSLETGSRADLATVLELFQRSPMFFGAEFPSKPDDTPVVCEKFISHATGVDGVREAPTIANISYKKDLLWTDARDVWYVLVDSCWAEFIVPCIPQRPIPLIDAVPLAAWIYIKPEDKKRSLVQGGEGGRPHRKLLMQYYSQDKSQGKELHVLAHTTRLVSVQIDHHQLIFILRLAEELAEMAAFLSADTASIDPVASTVAIGALLPQVDAALLLPQQTAAAQILPQHKQSRQGSSCGQLNLVRTPTPPQNNVSEANSSEEEKELHLGKEKTSISSETQGLKLEPVIDHSDPLTSSGYSSSRDGSSGSGSAANNLCASANNNQGKNSAYHREPTPTDLSNDNSADAINRASPLSSLGHSMDSAVSTPQHTFGGRPTPKLNLVPTLSSESVRSDTLRSEWGSSKSKGITSSFNSIMDSMRFTKELRSPEMDIETMSVRSDESGESSMWESEGFVVLNTEENISELLFAVHHEERGISPAEMAEEADEAREFLDPSGDRTPPVNRIQDTELEVSILNIHLGKIQFAQLSGSTGAALPDPGVSKQELHGDDVPDGNSSSGDEFSRTSRPSIHGDPSSVLISVGSLVIDQVQVLPWKSFQARFLQSGKCWSDVALQELDKATVKIRMESRSPLHPHLALQDLPPDLVISVSERISRCSDSSLELEASGLNLDLMTSTLAKLGEWAQDESIATPPPFAIRLKDIHVRLEDDGPLPPGLPPPPPVLLKVPQLDLARDNLGVINVVKAGGGSMDNLPHNTPVDKEKRKLETERQLELSRLEVQLLREQLALQKLEISKQQAKTKSVEEEFESKCEQVSTMLEERESLLQTLNFLQGELLKTGKK